MGTNGPPFTRTLARPRARDSECFGHAFRACDNPGSGLSSPRSRCDRPVPVVGIIRPILVILVARVIHAIRVIGPLQPKGWQGICCPSNLHHKNDTMKRIAIAALALIGMAMIPATEVSADYGFGYSGFPLSRTTSLQNPPYFAMHPPVYYGARHTRPYGLSPFAAQSLLSAGADYHGRLMHSGGKAAKANQTDAASVPSGNPYVNHSGNPYVEGSTSAVKVGQIKQNPYYTGMELVAK